MAKCKTICEKKIILKCGLSVMYLLAFLLVPTHFLHKEAVCWLNRDGLRGSPNTLYKLKTAAGSMAGVRNAQKKNKMLLCGFYLTCLQGKG